MMDQQHDRQSVSTAGPSRALTVVQRPESVKDERPLSGFLTQLIACDRRLPAYRAARTTEPERAISAYAGQSGPVSAKVQRVV